MNALLLGGRALKVTIVLDSAEVAALAVPDGQPRVTLRVNVGGRIVSAEVASKSLRKAIGPIRETGADGWVVSQFSWGVGDRHGALTACSSKM